MAQLVECVPNFSEGRNKEVDLLCSQISHCQVSVYLPEFVKLKSWEENAVMVESKRSF